MNRGALAVSFFLALLSARIALADAPVCSVNTGGTTDPPSGRVFVMINAMDLNTDMDDDIWPFDNHADVFGKITINADGTEESFDLRKMDEMDDPVWPDGNYFVSRPAIPGVPVRITIHLQEADTLATGEDDMVDINPDAAKVDLEIVLDTCAMTLSGDKTGTATGPLSSYSGTGDDQGTLHFRVGMDDNRAVSTVSSDVVLQGLDLIQVLPNAPVLIAGKPTVGLVTVANNTPAAQPVSVRLVIRDETNVVLHNVTESIGTLDIGEVRSVYLGTATPFVPTDFQCKPSKLTAYAELVLNGGVENAGDPKTACWLINNSTGAKTWDVVSTEPIGLTWQRVTTLGIHEGTMTELAAMRDQAMPFIRATYPIAAIHDSTSPTVLTPTVSGAVLDFIVALFALIGIDTPEKAVPYAMVMELNASSVLLGVDRLMGTLPIEWFADYSHDMAGISLGELMPHAVIFEGQSKRGSVVAPRPTIPAHELGHTYGLSVDPDLKGWWCQLSSLLCGMDSGFDEYEHPTYPEGLPTWGYWIPQGPGVQPAVTGEQCDSACFMGPSLTAAYDSWFGVGGDRKWIDAADYAELVRDHNDCDNGPIVLHPLYLSGVIGADDTAVLGRSFALDSGRLTFDDAKRDVETLYGVVIADGSGRTLSQASLPQATYGPELGDLGMTFFGGLVALPTGAKQFRVVNRISGQTLAQRTFSANKPTASAPTLRVRTANGVPWLDISWVASDKDKDALTHFIHVKPTNGTDWWPVAHGITAPSFSASLAAFARGAYTVRVLSSDGVYVGSASAAFTY